MNKKQVFLLKLAFGISLIAFLLYKVGIKDIYEILLNINLLYIPLILALYFLNLIIGTFNIKILLSQLEYKISLRKLFKYYLVSWSLGLFLPGKIGEFSIIHFLKKEKIPVGESAAVSVLDKIMTIITLSILSVVGFFIFLNFTQSLRLIIIMLTGFLFLLFLISNRGRSLIRKYILRKYADKFAGFSKTLFFYLRERKKILALNFFLTLTKWLIMALIVYIIFLSIGQEISLIYIILITAMITVISLVPISMSGLGVRESVALFLYAQISAPTAITASMLMLSLAISYSIASVSLLIFVAKTSRFFKDEYKTR